MKKLKTNLQFKVTIPVLVVLIVLSVMVSYIEHYIEFNKLHKQQMADIHKAEWMLTREIEDQTLIFSLLADSICENTAIQQAFLDNDRQTLWFLTGSIFSELKNRYNITHFNFHQLDNTCFMRVNKPYYYGDVIERETLTIASQQGKPSCGLELGAMGTFALRYIQPWRVNGELIGFLELGEDMGNIAQDLKKVLGFEFAIMINKSYVNRDNWQRSLEMLGRSDNWDLLDEAVVAGTTFNEFPNELYNHIQIGFDEAVCDITPLIKVDDKKYAAGCFGLFDVKGAHVGRMLVVQDMTVPASVINATTVFFGMIIIVAGSLASLLFYLYIGPIERRLKETDRKQRGEIRNRRLAESQLAKEKERAETALVDLRQAQRKLKLHIKQTPLGVIQWSPELIAETWNTAAESIFGYSAQEAIGRSAYDLIIPEETQKDANEICHKLVVTMESSISRNINNTSDGRRVMCQWYNTPLVDKAGKVVGISSIVQDITKTFKYEQRLRDAKEQAEAANLSKSMFMANMTHELRTPMNAILGFSDLLREEALNDEQHDYIETIYNSGQHLLGLINDVLDFSKIEAGKLEIVNERCAIRPLLKQIESMMQHAAAKAQLDFKVIASESLPAEIIVDAKRLHQCLINLLGNAIKFTPEQGTVSLRVGLLDDDANPWLYFEVADTGIGIPKDRVDKIFESFEQADTDTSIKYGGTGLGLAISQKMVEMMGGALTVESEEGIGSIFTITLPFEPAPQQVA